MEVEDVDRLDRAAGYKAHKKAFKYVRNQSGRTI